MNLEDIQNKEEIDDPLMILKAILLQVEYMFMFVFMYISAI